MEDFNSTQKKNFFSGEMGVGQTGQLRLAVSHPWPGPVAPDSPLGKIFFFQGRWE